MKTIYQPTEETLDFVENISTMLTSKKSGIHFWLKSRVSMFSPDFIGTLFFNEKRMEDNWHDIPWYEWLYQINWFTNEIKSILYGKTGKPRILKNEVNKYGHIKIGLYKNKKAKTYWFHQLVMLIKEWPCPEWLEVCHNDWNPQNNLPRNLRYDTRKNNVLDAVTHGTCSLIGNKNKASPVKQYSKEGIFIKYWESQAEVFERLKINQWNISAVCRWLRKYAWWYKWSYA